MRIFTKISVLLATVGILIIVGLKSHHASYAETTTITIGPWTFDNAAFADDVTVLDAIKEIRIDTIDNCAGSELSLGTQRFEECVDLALTGYSPETFFVNVGSVGDTLSNWFQLDFTDIKVENHVGPDLVLFECHFTQDVINDYEIAVRPEGGAFTEFVTFFGSAFQETDSVCYDPTTNWGLEIDLAAFSLPSGTIVDAIQFRVVDPDPGDPNVQPEGEPSMVAVLTNVGSPNIYLPIISR